MRRVRRASSCSPRSSKSDARAGDDVLDCARDEHLAGKGGRSDSRGDVDRNSADAPWRSARPRRCGCRPAARGRGREPTRDRRSAANGAGGAVEVATRPLADRADLAATKALELRAHDAIVPREQLLLEASPPALAAVDDVSEEQGGEHAVRLEVLPEPVRNRSISSSNGSIALPRQVVVARQLDHARARDVLAHESRPVAPAFLCAVEHERRDADRRQQVADVDFGVHESDRLARAGARAASHVRRVPAEAPPGRAARPGRRVRASLSSPPPPSRPPRAARGAGGDSLRSRPTGSPAPASRAGTCPSKMSAAVRAGGSRRRASTSLLLRRCPAGPPAPSRRSPALHERRPYASRDRAVARWKHDRRGRCRACRRG